MRARTRTVPVVLAAALLGCAGAPDRTTRLGWWRSDDRFLVGRGEGATAQEAHAEALADLASQVRAEVSARTERFAEARRAGGTLRASVGARHDVAVAAHLEHGELARRRLRRTASGRAEVVVSLDRAAWATRRRADVADEATLVLRALDDLVAPSTESPARRWTELGRAVAAARVWRVAEQEAAAVGPPEQDARPPVAAALETLLRARDAVGRQVECLVAIEGDPIVQALAEAACGAVHAPAVLGPRASDERTVVLRGRVERSVAREGSLVFAESRLVLAVDADDHTVETLVIGGASTRRAHLDVARAKAAADTVLEGLVAESLGGRFR